MTQDQFCEYLRRICQKAGGQSAWARDHDLTQQYVSDVINKRRKPGDKICRAAGIVRDIVYRKLK